MASTPAVPHLPESTAYSRPVPREFVHKKAHGEVLLTGWRRCGGGRLEVGAQWPRDHGFWRTDGDGVQDPLLLVETTRQVLPLLSHAAYGVPQGWQLIWDRYRCDFAAPFLSVAGGPAEVVLRLSATPDPDRAGRGARARRISLAMSIHGAGRELGRVATDYSAHSPGVYRRLRGPGTPEPEEAMATAVEPPPALPPREVGRESEREVVLGPADEGGDGAVSGRRWRLRVLTTSPWVFDHPTDHAPGMLLIEAARQAVHLAAAPGRPQLTVLEADFHRYVDLDAPSWVEVSPGLDEGGGGEGEERRSGAEQSLTVHVTQRGDVAFTAVVRYLTRPVAGERPPVLG
jgi:hypothetical protein